jgi:urea transport system ATP-binding protein
MPEITDLNRHDGVRRTLWEIDTSVPEGSCTCLMGRNGMGKTTLPKCMLAGLTNELVRAHLTV